MARIKVIVSGDRGPRGDPGASSVISRTTADPPAEPAEGDRYLVPAGATDAWAGLEGKIVQYSTASASWVQYAAVGIFGIEDEDDGVIFRKPDGTIVNILTGTVEPP